MVDGRVPQDRAAVAQKVWAARVQARGEAEQTETRPSELLRVVDAERPRRERLLGRRGAQLGKGGESANS